MGASPHIGIAPATGVSGLVVIITAGAVPLVSKINPAGTLRIIVPVPTFPLPRSE